MGLIVGFLNANICGKIALILLLVAEVMSWLSFAMNDWGRYDTNIVNNDDKKGFGVWKVCGNQEPNPDCQDTDGFRLAWYGAFQAFAIFGFMGVSVAFLFIILLLFVNSCVKNRDLSLACAISAFVGTVGWVIAVILFGVRFDETYDGDFDRETFRSSFILAILAAFCALGAGICAIIGVRGGQQVASSSPAEDKPESRRATSGKKDKKRQVDEEQGKEGKSQQQRYEEEDLERQRQKKKKQQQKYNEEQEQDQEAD